MGHVRDDDLMWEGGLARGGHIDGVDFLGDEALIIGGVEALDEDGLGVGMKTKVREA